MLRTGNDHRHRRLTRRARHARCTGDNGYCITDTSSAPAWGRVVSVPDMRAAVERQAGLASSIVGHTDRGDLSRGHFVLKVQGILVSVPTCAYDAVQLLRLELGVHLARGVVASGTVALTLATSDAHPRRAHLPPHLVVAYVVLRG